jgi:ketosteroid isomerase-like protein
MAHVEFGDSPTAALVAKTLGIYDAKEFDRLSEVMHEDVKLTFLGETSVGIPHVKATLEALYTAIPDQTHTIERITIDDEHEAVAIQMLVAGTHDNAPFPTAFGEVPPSGNHVEWRPGSFIQAREGKVDSWTVYLDQVSVLRALGVELAPATPIEA